MQFPDIAFLHSAVIGIHCWKKLKENTSPQQFSSIFMILVNVLLESPSCANTNTPGIPGKLALYKAGSVFVHIQICANISAKS